MPTKTKRTVADVVTDSIIAALDEGTVPWDRPWKAMPGFGAPGNVVSKRPYRGVNVLLTAFQPFAEPWWITRKQAHAKDLRIADNQFKESTPIVLWKPTERRCPQDTPGAVFVNGEWVKRSMILRFYSVWNVEQIEGYRDDPTLGGLVPPPPEPPSMSEREVEARCMFEDYLHREGIALGYGGDSASYMPTTDAVRLPSIESFKTVPGFLHTAFHEAGHSTGHEKRLARPSVMSPAFGSEPYAQEELVAELTAAMCCSSCGIDPDVQRSAAYIENWLQVLRDDRGLIITAAQAAQKAHDLILDPTTDEEDPS